MQSCKGVCPQKAGSNESSAKQPSFDESNESDPAGVQPPVQCQSQQLRAEQVQVVNNQTRQFRAKRTVTAKVAGRARSRIEAG